MHRFDRRRFLGTAAAGLAAAMGTRAALAQAYPNKPVHWVVGFAPGGTTDLVARLINPIVAARLGQPVIIENQPGAGGVVATGGVAKAAADGYTLLHTSNAFLTVTPHLMKVPFDPLQDLEPVAYLGSSVQILCVHPDLPVRSVAEFVAYAKANPGRLNYGSSGTATGNHITCEYMKRAAGFDAVHVPYKGAGPAITDLLGGRLQFMTDPALMPHIQSGKVRALGIVDAPSHPMLPSLPPLSAAIANWNPPLWYNFVSVPAKTPQDARDRVDAAVREAINTPSVREKFGENSFLAGTMSAAELRAKLKTEYLAMGELLKAADIRMA